MEKEVYGIDKERVAWRDIEGEITILDKKAGEFFHLNAAACRIWHLIQDGASVDEIISDLGGHFDAGEETLRGDITAFVGELSGKGFIKRQ